MKSPHSRRRLARRLRNARVTARMSQERVAQELAISRPMVAHFESGKVVPDSLRLAELCELYGVPASLLLFGYLSVPIDWLDEIPAGACAQLDRAREHYRTYLAALTRPGHDSGRAPLG